MTKHISPEVRNQIERLVLRIILLSIGIVMFFPFWWMVSGSVKSSDQVLAYPPALIPNQLHFENYVQVFTDVPFARYMLNSFIVATVVTLAGLLFHSMAGYALACLNFPGRNVLFGGILSTMMIPFYSIMIPLFILVQKLGWLDSYAGLIVPWIPHAFGIFMMRQYYLMFPRELRDAATIDGCSPIGTFFRIALPTSAPILAALAIIFFVSNWDRFLWPLLVTTSPEMRVIQLGIVQFKGQYVVNWHLIMAAAMIGCIPTLILFTLLQNRIVEGIKMTGVKG
jgi:multiple sugar transport system permease protein